MMIYLDYLDFHILGENNTLPNEIRLKFDFLAFYHQVFCLLVPACVKLESTTLLLESLSSFWKSGYIKIIFDKKDTQNPFYYFSSRNKKLEASMPEEKLVQHFEFKAYNSSRPDEFFNKYLGQFDDHAFFAPKVSHTDSDFRKKVITTVDVEADNICSAFSIKERMRLAGALSSLTKYADDKTVFFQRSIVDDLLKVEFQLDQIEVNILRNILDKSFAFANAVSSGAVPVSLIQNQITGKYIAELLHKCNNDLFILLSGMTYEQIFELCDHATWHDFVDILNEIVFDYQINKKHNGQLPKVEELYIQKETINMLNSVLTHLESSASEFAMKHGLLYQWKNSQDYINLLSNYIVSRNVYIDNVKKLNNLIPEVYKCAKQISTNKEMNWRQRQQQKGFIF